ncbi:hypothetical protein [Methylobacterium sp. J-076]|uniref:hypothetical protein n=1 Tax=Methylobacterium sp. J-076 TaxID=2836655 RepID=UPI001FBA9CEF|nr:hypothetical protein [Methylobacterium sp. J-076]MCJ2014200.1 hypothetical protein [Methylobacterium sp. J-076]
MSEIRKHVPEGERDRGGVRAARGTGTPREGDGAARMRAPKVYRRGSDPEFRMTFVVADRRYYGHTGHVDEGKARGWADAAYAERREEWRARSAAMAARGR